MLATSCAGAEEAIGACHSTAADLELSVSFSMTKFLVVVHGVMEEDMQPIVTPGGTVHGVCVLVCISRFPDNI